MAEVHRSARKAGVTETEIARIHAIAKWREENVGDDRREEILEELAYSLTNGVHHA